MGGYRVQVFYALTTNLVCCRYAISLMRPEAERCHQVMFPRPYSWHRIPSSSLHHILGQSYVALNRLLDTS